MGFMSKGKFKVSLKTIRPTSILMLVVSAFLSGVGIMLFISAGKFYTGGITGIAQYAKFFANDNEMVFNLTYYALNLPLVIFGLKKIGMRFTIMTIIYIILVPLFKDLVGALDLTVFENAGNERLLIALSGGIIYGGSIALAYKTGASSGGTDFVATYYATNKGTSIGKITTTITYTIILTGQILVATFKPDTSKSFLENIINETLLYTLVFVFITGFAIDKLYPKGKKISIHCTTTKGKQIIQHFKDINYIHAITIVKSRGVVQSENEILVFGSYFMESEFIMNEIHKVDPNAFMMIYSVVGVKGRFVNKKVKNVALEEKMAAKAAAQQQVQ